MALTKNLHVLTLGTKVLGKKVINAWQMTPTQFWQQHDYENTQYCAFFLSVWLIVMAVIRGRMQCLWATGSQ